MNTMAPALTVAEAVVPAMVPEGGEEEKGDEEGEEGRKVRGLRGPQRVTKEEREEHDKTHTP